MIAMPFFLRALLDLFLPRECLACGCRLGLRERHLCLSCAADVPYTYYWLQAHNPLADRFNAVLERHRDAAERMDYAYAAALMHYKGPYRAIPRALKYHADLDAGRFYGSLLGRRIASAPHFADVDLILPVPLHWTRRRSRGYNQAEILARAVCATLNASRFAPTDDPACHSEEDGVRRRNLPPPIRCRTDILLRARRTRTQTKLTVEQKASNVASAFQVSFLRSRLFAFPRSRYSASQRSRLDWESPREALVHARHILLVDDTFTTGATLYACYAALRPFTSARISIATLAAVEGNVEAEVPGSEHKGP